MHLSRPWAAGCSCGLGGIEFGSISFAGFEGGGFVFADRVLRVAARPRAVAVGLAFSSRRTNLGLSFHAGPRGPEGRLAVLVPLLVCREFGVGRVWTTVSQIFAHFKSGFADGNEVGDLLRGAVRRLAHGAFVLSRYFLETAPGFPGSTLLHIDGKSNVFSDIFSRSTFNVLSIECSCRAVDAQQRASERDG